MKACELSSSIWEMLVYFRRHASSLANCSKCSKCSRGAEVGGRVRHGPDRLEIGRGGTLVVPGIKKDLADTS
jgi:hypothetical protein